MTDYQFLLLIQKYAWLFLILQAWSITWKGLALWRACRNNHKYWFIALLIVNTLGILEIIYYFFFGKKKK